MKAGQRSTTWNSPPLAPELFGLRWLRRESIRALSVQRVLANPSCLFAIAMPKERLRPSPSGDRHCLRDPGIHQAGDLESSDETMMRFTSQVV